MTGLLFAAHWCRYCRAFVPKLEAFYDNLQKRELGRFEVVYMSSDGSQSEFEENFRMMPWTAMPFGDPRKEVSVAKIHSSFSLLSLSACFQHTYTLYK